MFMRAFLLAAAMSASAAHVRAQSAADEFTSYADDKRGARIDVPDDLDGPALDVKYLKQGWTPAQSMRFYSLPQGSKLIPYRWFLALEQAGAQTPFADPANMNRYRYLPLRADKDHNPDGLPIGFVREPTQPDDPKADWLGLTCAACHTAEIRHAKIAYRIDGGPAMADHDTFLLELTDAMKATLNDADKFGRFAKKALPEDTSVAAQAKLKDELRAHFDFRAKYNDRNATKVPYGFARLDAFGRIMNETLVRHIDVNVPSQFHSPDAPVSYPHLWGITRLDRVQWNGVARNTKLIVGPLGRNVGEVLGVFGEVEVPRLTKQVIAAVKGERGFDSSVRFRNLFRLEDTVDALVAPRWPDAFGKLDAAKVAAGKVLYEKHCLDCHNPQNKEGGFVQTTLTPVAQVKTDERMAKNFAERRGNVGNMKFRIMRSTKFRLLPDVFLDDARAVDLLVGVVERTIIGAEPAEFLDRVNLPQILKDLRDLKLLAIGRIRDSDDFDPKAYLDIDKKKDDLLVYRGRPLEGIWATAPYLHNGSVPNLAELLLPADKRSPVFRVGSREFDPVNVGFRTDKGAAFDTSLPGNSNRGHDMYGRKDLEDPQNRAALLEYLKSL
jgi:hypothetical protein